MNWSFSAARTFKQCQRRWFFKTCLANARAKDPVRREAYVLSKLQSLSGWRGNLVDQVISRELVGAIKRGETIWQSQLLARARRSFDRQRDFALNHRIRDPDVSLAEHDGIAAFWSIEYGEPVSNDELMQAWNDVETAIGNLYKMERVREALKATSHLVAQRPLQFGFAGVNVRAVPDVIAFYDAEPPLIVDWKVQAAGSRDYRLQLAPYALALVRCAPHRDFPDALERWASTDIRLLEVQLLTAAEHAYRLTTEDFDELEDYIAASASEMSLATGGLLNGKLRAEDFAVTEWPEQCQRCAFRKLCWENADGRA